MGQLQNELLPFFMKHWELSLAFVVILLAIILLEMKEKMTGPNRLTVADAIDLINHQNAVVIDLRDQSDFAEGHIINAVNMPKDQFEKKEGDLQVYKSRPMILVCQSGQHSVSVAENLRKNGYEEVKILSGGIEAWKGADLPLEKI